MLNRDDFPGLTDEQWENLQAQFQAEGDRRATQASKTAKQGLLSQADVDAQIAAALAKERERLEADERGKLEIDRKALEAEQAKLAADRKSLVATKKLVEAGFSAEQAESLLPMFVHVEDQSFESTIDTFVKLNETTVKTQVDAEKQKLLGGATPPAGQTVVPADPNSAADAALKAGDEAGAAQALLDAAGYTPTQ